MHISLIELFIAFCASVTLSTIAMPFFITYFTMKKIGHVTREEGPSWHEVKTGTPTMGGIAFVISTIIVSFIFALYKGYVDFTIISLWIVLVSFGTIGFLDDFLKLVKQQNEGLTSRQKFLWQLLFSLIYIIFAVSQGLSTTLATPFGIVEMSYAYIIFALIWISGFSNAVNLTDGLDGLVAGLSTIGLSTYAYIAYTQHKYAIALFCVTLIGGIVGFFIFNKKPAKIFMGDVGSLSLGAVFAVLSMLLKVEFSLLLIGVVFVVETISVMLQVFWYKKFKKRIFKMSPIHHHFEMSGWSEWKVVTVFWIAGVLGALLHIFLF